MRYVQLDYKLIQDKYPKSLEKIINWFGSREDLITYLKREGTKDIMSVLKDQMVPMVIQHDPRKLYEFFDQQNIIIDIGYDDHGGGFTYSHTKGPYSSHVDNRIDAEEAAFMQAFDYLENTLFNGEG